MHRRVQVQGRGGEGRGGGRGSALPTRVSECDANGITQRSDIYCLLFSLFFFVLHFGFTVCVVALNHSRSTLFQVPDASLKKNRGQWVSEEGGGVVMELRSQHQSLSVLALSDLLAGNQSIKVQISDSSVLRVGLVLR